MFTCDRTEVLTAIAVDLPVNHTDVPDCNVGFRDSNEAFVRKTCNVTSRDQWHKGQTVKHVKFFMCDLQICIGGPGVLTSIAIDFMCYKSDRM